MKTLLCCIATILVVFGSVSAAEAIELSKDVFIKQYLPGYVFFNGETSATTSTAVATLRIPDGRTINSDVLLSSGAFSSGFYLERDYPIGKYTISVGGSSAIFEIQPYVSSTEKIQAECPGCESGTLVRFLSGDTLYIDDVKVRLALIDAPEKAQEGYGDAIRFANEVCPLGSTVLYNQDNGLLDDSFGLVAEVWCDGKSLNAELLKNDHVLFLKGFCDFSEFSEKSWATAECDREPDRYAEQGEVFVNIEGAESDELNSDLDKDSNSNDSKSETPDEITVEIESDIDEKIDNILPDLPEKITIAGHSIEPQELIDDAVNALPTVDIETNLPEEQEKALLYLILIVIIVVVIIILFIRRRRKNPEFSQGSYQV